MLDTRDIQCPYCWETFELVVDLSVAHQVYIEDCYVCCRPIHLIIDVIEQGECVIQALSEEESF
ncbi:MAG TPA: CPXCG motif-containing cysteine-rich protein [Thiomicrospira sp.]|nr:CPXCG motif-containing cysteine-rich protein [Thiomicrospira sp.]